MVDQIFDRTYRSGRAELHDGIDRALRRAVNATVRGFRALHRLQWSAPWQKKQTYIGCA